MPDRGPGTTFRERLERSVPLAPLTSWNIGGSAEFFAQPTSVDELRQLVDQARSIGLPLTVLGRGSNVLIDDDGVPGLVICTRMLVQPPSFSTDTVSVVAGLPMPRLAVTAARERREGLEFLVGIPGTVGAGVAINAGLGGVGGTTIGSVLLEAELLNPATGTIHTERSDELCLRYRHSNVPERGLWVVRATVTARQARDPGASKKLQQDILARRRAKQPLQTHTSGSVFRQPRDGEPAGWYIDKAGLKGFRVGGAVVSTVHANWIENAGRATSRDVREVMEHVTEAVHARFGVRLEPEVVMLPSQQ